MTYIARQRDQNHILSLLVASQGDTPDISILKYLAYSLKFSLKPAIIFYDFPIDKVGN